MKKWLQRKLIELLLPELRELARNEGAKIERQIAALQALDISFKGTSKIVILTRIGNRDFVKIIETRPRMTMPEYIELTKSLEAQYGATVSFIDTPYGAPNPITEFFIETEVE